MKEYKGSPDLYGCWLAAQAVEHYELATVR